MWKSCFHIIKKSSHISQRLYMNLAVNIRSTEKCQSCFGVSVLGDDCVNSDCSVHLFYLFVNIFLSTFRTKYIYSFSLGRTFLAWLLSIFYLPSTWYLYMIWCVYFCINFISTIITTEVQCSFSKLRKSSVISFSLNHRYVNKSSCFRNLLRFIFGLANSGRGVTFSLVFCIVRKHLHFLQSTFSTSPHLSAYTTSLHH